MSIFDVFSLKITKLPTMSYIFISISFEILSILVTGFGYITTSLEFSSKSTGHPKSQ